MPDQSLDFTPQRMQFPALQEVDEQGRPYVYFDGPGGTQVPQAVISLKQGVGRLIRDRSDRGVLVLCDPRLRTRSYGRVFLDSLPGMPQTSRMDAVHEFFSGHKPAIVEQTVQTR